LVALGFGVATLATYRTVGVGGLIAVFGFATVTLLALASPRLGVSLLIAVSLLLPLDVAIHPPGLPRLGPTRLVMTAVLIGIGLHLATRVRRVSSLVPTSLALAIVAYLICGALSALMSVETRVSIYAVIGRDIIEQIVPFLLFLVLFRDRSWWLHVRKALYVTAAIACGVGFAEAFTDSALYASFLPDTDPILREGFARVRGTFLHPIAFGCFICFVYPLVLADVLETDSIWRRLALVVLAACLIAALVLTVSRSPWLVSGFETLLLLVVWARGRALRMAATWAIGTAAIVVSLAGYVLLPGVRRLVDPVLGLFSPGGLDEGSSEFYRVALFRAVVERLDRLHWIYGYGPNAFYLSDVTATYAGVTHVLGAPDSHYLKLLLEYGVAGLVAFLVMLALSLEALRHSLSLHAPNHRLLVAACLVSVLGFAVENLSVSYFQMYPLGMLFWMTVALGVSSPCWKLQPSSPLANQGS
jgi:hypothetical protein